MIKDRDFWLSEDSKSILLKKNNGFITSENSDEKCEIAQKWLNKLYNKKNFNEKEDFKLIKTLDEEEYYRIFKLDADRTYITQERREKHIQILCTSFQFVKDYHQGLGFIAAWLGLYFEPIHVIDIIKELNTNHMNGYFKAMSVALFRDAKAVEYCLLNNLPLLSQHFTDQGIVAATYASKWFAGLCLHVLNYKSLFRFYELFFEHKFIYLFNFTFNLLKYHHDKIISTTDTAHILAILRHEESALRKAYGDDVDIDDMESNIIEGSLSFVISDGDIKAYREDAQRALDEEAAKRFLNKDEGSDDSSEIMFSDEDSSYSD